ncbi:MAG: methylmalonyl Co-A mutase-associated GTPase MeaB [Anaerolineales bacterium]|nr:methylmalonyl Co-A mutase-associated GTPase MeaB [Anaerolineales bacterium]
MASVQEVLSGNRLSLARLLSQIENDTPDGRAALSELFPHTGQAHLIGVTGAPGTGKSSLVNQLAHYYRHPPENKTPKRVAIVAIDPSSPFSGGAVLGDRVRMRDLAGDPGVFIRSMASRGSLGGLARTTSGVVQAFDAAGFEIILIETVGAGQAEVDIARLAHTTLVVEAPGLGDDIQAIKAGILEIADILVVNKADRAGVENTERALRNMLNLAHPVKRVYRHHGTLETVPAVPASTTESPEQESVWVPPIQKTVATDGTGVPELGDLIAQHKAHLEQTGDWEGRQRARLQAELDGLLQIILVSRWRDALSPERYQEVLEQLIERNLSPRQAVEELLNGAPRS